MNDKPRRRLLDRLGSSPNFIDSSSRLTGDLETAGSMILCGKIYGDGSIGGALSTARDSEWKGEVHAKSAVIAGVLIGKLVVAEKIEVGAAATIRGDVIAGSLAIARGAVIDGEVTVTSGQEILRFEEKRTK